MKISAYLKSMGTPDTINSLSRSVKVASQALDSDLKKGVMDKGIERGSSDTAYTVTLSEEGLKRQEALFKKDQNTESSRFQKEQERDEAQFRQEQASEEAAFRRNQARELNEFQRKSSLRSTEYSG